MCHCASQCVNYYGKQALNHINNHHQLTPACTHHWPVKTLGGHVRGDFWCHGNHSHPALVSITHRFRTGAGAYAIIGVLFAPRGQGHLSCEEFLIGFICFDAFPG